MKSSLAVLAALVLANATCAPAQPAPAADIALSLRKLNETGTVLMIAAHPDDERTNVLTYFARGRYMRTGYLSLTRGEGGQNLIGSEQGAALGMIRTQELLAARRIDGAEQFFSRAIDFGFTKTAAETMEKWGHDRVLSDVVWVIRRYRPDVIILGFSGTPADGHGQHQASAILGKEAFEAAADPAKFPEQLKFVQPWKTKKIVYAGGFGGGGGRGPAAAGAPGAGGRAGRGGRGGNAPAPNTPNANPLADGSFPPPPGPPIAPANPVATAGFSPFLGYTFDQLASISRSQHRSQGFGNIGQGPGRGPAGGPPGANTPPPPPPPPDLFTDIDHSWSRVPGGSQVGTLLSQAVREYDVEHPEKLLPLLGQVRPLIAAINDPLAKVKLAEADELIAKCAGMWAEAQIRQAEVVPGAKVPVALSIYPRLNVPVTVQSVQPEGVWTAAPLTTFQPRSEGGVTGTLELTVPANQPYSYPYWLEKPTSGERYVVENQMLAGLPESPVEQVRIKLTVAGTPIEIVRNIENHSSDRAEVERIRPLTVVPPVSVNMPGPSVIFPSAASHQISVRVHANIAGAEGTVRLEAPAGWKALPASQTFKTGALGEERELGFDITPPAAESTAKVRAVASVGGREVSVGMFTLDYPHISVEVLFPPSELRVVRADIKVTSKNIGYIMGAGDEVPEAIRNLGVQVTMLSEADLVKGNLSQYDAIVAGVRAYNVRPDLRANHARLMEYVNNGGTFVVQYQSAGAGSENIGPYKITIPNGNGFRVTVEDSPVAFPHVDSRLLQYPNRITSKDFEGWVQERALLFPTEWDPKYETVLSAADPGEKPMEGGTLWTHYGKGVYVFTNYVWFRQLPAGVPGAYRIFANLLSAK
ncbi:MAG: LmbE family protein [Bryobacterales bacterium]|nr:LmbE family protein [Bryobacterales bacterium]